MFERLAILSVTAALVLSGCVETGSTGAPATTSATTPAVNDVAFRSSVSLAVGESAIVHGNRGDCGSLPSEAELVKDKANLDAASTLGTFSFGAPGQRRSGACGGNTPVRETIFTAVTPGRQTMKVHGDDIRFTVR